MSHSPYYSVYIMMGIDQPKVSALLNGRLANFSSDRLMRFLTARGQDVEITIKSKPRNRAHGRIRVVIPRMPEATRHGDQQSRSARFEL